MPTWPGGLSREEAKASPLRALVAGFPGGAAHVTGDLIWINKITEQIVGYTAEELPTMDAWGVAVHGDAEPAARDAYLAARAQGFPEPVDLTVIRKDGSTRLVEFCSYLGDGEEVWVLSDITEARHAEQALRDREQRLQVAVTTAGLGICEWDVTTGYFLGNPATRRLFGITGSDRNRYEDYADRVLIEDRPLLDHAVERALSTQSSFDVELRVATDHGRNRWLRVHGAVVSDPDHSSTRIVGAVRDIDSYKRLDERLVHAAQMESLGQLAGGVAHDFNNLLAVIQGQVEFVSREPGLSDRTQGRIASIERAVSKGADMVATLMRLGRSSSPELHVIDINQALAVASDALSQVAGADVVLTMSLDAASPHVRFGDTQLSAMMLNLVTNARDAMSGGGELTIETRNVPSADPEVSDEVWLQLVVEDTGVGIDAATRARIFEPFFTTKPPSLGSGLGLASVYDAVMDAGGGIDVDSTPGVGTRFSISLPCAPAPAAGDTSSSSVPETCIGCSVMVVEDDESILTVTADILRDAGYLVTPALGSTQALRLFETGTRPDLLLTDVVMPDLSGPALADRVAETMPDLPVLFMSGYTAEGRGGIPLDDERLLRKPFTHQQLLERVAALLRP